MKMPIYKCTYHVTREDSGQPPQEGYHVVDPAAMSNRSLRDHFCDPWFGCFRCTSRCEFGREYMRRVEAGEIMKIMEATTI